jgi:hypothetical protein
MVRRAVELSRFREIFSSICLQQQDKTLKTEFQLRSRVKVHLMKIMSDVSHRWNTTPIVVVAQRYGLPFHIRSVPNSAQLLREGRELRRKGQHVASNSVHTHKPP